MDIKRLMTLGKARQYKTDEFVFYEGDVGEEMYILLKGKVGVFTNNINGSKCKIVELESGDFFGEMALIDGSPRSADILALDDISVFVITKANFEQVIVAFPDLALRIMKGMSLRVREQNKIISNMRSPVKQISSLLSKQITTDSNNEDTPQRPSHNAEKPNENVTTLEISLNRDEESHVDETNNKKETKIINYDQIIVPENYNKYIFTGDVECPVCDKKFTTDKIRNTMLKMDKEDRDFRTRYKEFEPYWYKIWVCPHCYYANFDYIYNQVSYLKKKTILSQTKQLKQKYLIDVSKKRTLKDVLRMFFLCQEIHQITPMDRLSYAKAWLFLTWIYEDIGDTDMVEVATEMALNSYIDTHQNDVRGLANGQEIRLALLIGELYIRQNKLDEAVKYLAKAVQMRSEPKRMRELASDRMIELKEKLKAAKKQESTD
ncbi:hypothetical protein BHU72_04070 [Desulfuribacillus stibiiarsenatis]|uniref:Cyclic nucleotide-binding domain-containing protein n=2 Tax=Desulfuribacillus stibiiarsenatis TaxID=1390249 RepID=A0A1E5L585_9FIRM|nr:hypothetical protein BHU72_04070 [Desulfuribacillus stibiiarsenatis]